MAEISTRLQIDYISNATIVTFTDKGILDTSDIKAVGDSLISIIEQSKGVNMVLNFQNVKFLSSSVLGLLIRISKRIYENDGQLSLCCISDKLYEVFRITRLNKVFNIYCKLLQYKSQGTCKLYAN